MNLATQDNVPTLRFPEFAGEWEFCRLSERVTKVGSGVTPKGGANVYQTVGIPLLRSQNVRDSFLDLADVAFISEMINAGMSGSAVQTNDVLLNITGASIGRSCVVPSEIKVANVNQHVCIIRPNEKNSPNFLQSFLASYKGQKLIFQSQCGGGREGLNFENIKAFKTIFPSLPEQQKIASFLSAVSEKIEQLTQKRALLMRYKKGMMQKIFSQEKVPALRFPEFSDEWITKKLGNFFTFKNGVNADKSQYGFGSKFINVLDIIADKPITSGRIIGSVSISDKEFEKNKVVFGDILFQRSSETREEVGQSNVYLDKENPATFGGFVIRGQPKIKLNSKYFHYLLKTNNARKDVTSRSGGSTRYNVGQKSLSAVLLSTTPSLPEQQKIADFLSSLDDKIDLVATELGQAQTFKKGLLQQMFV